MVLAEQRGQYLTLLNLTQFIRRTMRSTHLLAEEHLGIFRISPLARGFWLKQVAPLIPLTI
ncbi:hypothetical protein [Bradyrhizobium sp. CCBAU 45394]|uniref:hypothetical protein n=1 Tax=Bradyrhizobium sp. CCBAU 45394 TaxID=1325087 RepID=UPI002302A878|nr:hypothetical protein [Bradyrhizobium sp. CCBAU 45394]